MEEASKNSIAEQNDEYSRSHGDGFNKSPRRNKPAADRLTEEDERRTCEALNAFSHEQVEISSTEIER